MPYMTAAPSQDATESVPINCLLCKDGCHYDVAALKRNGTRKARSCVILQLLVEVALSLACDRRTARLRMNQMRFCPDHRTLLEILDEFVPVLPHSGKLYLLPSAFAFVVVEWPPRLQSGVPRRGI